MQKVETALSLKCLIKQPGLTCLKMNVNSGQMTQKGLTSHILNIHSYCFVLQVSQVRFGIVTTVCRFLSSGI